MRCGVQSGIFTAGGRWRRDLSSGIVVNANDDTPTLRKQRTEKKNRTRTEMASSHSNLNSRFSILDCHSSLVNRVERTDFFFEDKTRDKMHGIRRKRKNKRENKDERGRGDVHIRLELRVVGWGLEV